MEDDLVKSERLASARDEVQETRSVSYLVTNKNTSSINASRQITT